MVWVFWSISSFVKTWGTEPMPILNCGLSCQFGAGEVVTLGEMGPYVQDALDLVEFANGNATTWEKSRFEQGHEALLTQPTIQVYGFSPWEELSGNY